MSKHFRIIGWYYSKCHSVHVGSLVLLARAEPVKHLSGEDCNAPVEEGARSNREVSRLEELIAIA